ncbi:MAG: hypothetical protein HKL82_05815 [Acidimicrobiaceae bacterium]|nr:hypothetical protein [Acidimicrobiaceae bacterium]
MFEYRRRLLRRKGICIAEDDSGIQLHISAGDSPVSVAAVDLGQPDSLIDVQLSPAGRLHAAALWDVNRWDKALLQRLRDEALTSISARRHFANEALSHGWYDVFDELDLTPSEKTWRRACEAAAKTNPGLLFAHLSALPARGYSDRVGLALPFITQISADPATWQPIISTWANAGIPLASEFLKALWPARLSDAKEAFLSLARFGGMAEDRIAEWGAVFASFEERLPPEPASLDCLAWRSVAVYSQGVSGKVVDKDFAAVSLLPRPLLDDLIDAGAITPLADFGQLPAQELVYVIARCDPSRLQDSDLVSLSHSAEIARRAFVDRDRSALERLSDSASGRHFANLLDVLEGLPPDPDRLSPEAYSLIQAVFDYRTLVDANEAKELPEEFLEDPSVWYLLSVPAREGRLPRLGSSLVADRFGSWMDQQRLLGLIWEQRWSDAVDLGQAVLETELESEVYSDEVASMTAYALYQCGRISDAMEVINSALEGIYTEALLVNASIIASDLEPSLAMPLLARLVREAPNEQLQAVALRRALEIWNQMPDPEFPQVLVEPLLSVLSRPCSIDDYALFARLAVLADPKRLLSLSEPAGEAAGPYRIAVARSKFRVQNDYLQADLARDMIRVYEQFGRMNWFESEWQAMLEAFRNAIFVDWGEGYGAAVFWDTVFVECPDLIDPIDRLIFLPQAGAHFAAAFAKNSTVLNEDAWRKFFYAPAEELISTSVKVDDHIRNYVALNLSKSLFIATGNFLVVSRNSLAENYNTLLGRLRWDSEHRFGIIQSMRAVLDTSNDRLAQADRSLDRLRRLPIDEEENRVRIREIEETIADWRKEIVNLRTNL